MDSWTIMGFIGFLIYIISAELRIRSLQRHQENGWQSQKISDLYSTVVKINDHLISLYEHINKINDRIGRMLDMK